MTLINLMARRIDRLKNKLRTAYYNALFSSFGRDSVVLGRIKVYHPEKIRIGSGCRINEGCILNARGGLVIGDGVNLSPGVIINTGYLDISKFPEKTHKVKPVEIKDNAWLASGAIVNPGVVIGENSILAAGAVATKDIPPDSIALGVPAKVRQSE